MNKQQIYTVILMIILTVIAAGCGQSGPSVYTIELVPTAIKLEVGQSIDVTAIGRDEEGTAIAVSPEWSVDTEIGTALPRRGSSVTTFTATNVGTGILYARVGNVTEYIPVEVVPPKPVLTTLTVEPAVINLRIGQSHTFTVRGLDQFGNPIEFDPTWSLDGDVGSLTPQNGHTALLTTTKEGEAIITATADGVSAEARVYLQGPKILFVSDRDGKREIYVMNRDGSNQTRLTNTKQGYSWCPAWSPDGTKIAYTHSVNDYTHEVYVMNADGSRPTRVGPGMCPEWLHDGRLLYVSSRDTPNYQNLWIMNADGRFPTPFTSYTNRDGYLHVRPRFSVSPDGTSVLYSYSLAVYGGILRVRDLATGVAEDLYKGEILDPSWSPDGKTVAFSEVTRWYGECLDSTIYLMGTDGTGLRQLTNIRLPDQRYPTWSPDGKRIAFEARDEGTGGMAIYVIGMDGSGIEQLTERAEYNNTAPSWSPF